MLSSTTAATIRRPTQARPSGHDARRIDHRGDAAFHVLRSAAVEPAVALDRRERIAHPGHTDGVGMPAEHQRGTFDARLQHADHVGPATAGIFDRDLQTDAPHRAADGVSDLAFAGRAGHQRGIDGVDGDEIAQQFDGRIHVLPNAILGATWPPSWLSTSPAPFARRPAGAR
jgi:hypothetical protein